MVPDEVPDSYESIANPKLIIITYMMVLGIINIPILGFSFANRVTGI